MTSMVRHLVVAAALGMIAQGVWAQGDAWYVAGGLGGSLPADVDVRPTGVGSSARTVQLDAGILVSGAFGRSFGNFRAEGELVYNTNPFRACQYSPTTDRSSLTNSRWV